MPVNIVERDGEVVVLYDHMMTHMVRDALRNRLYDLTHCSQERDFWFRCTNDKGEDAICGQIVSLNHRDNIREAGMSVSEGVHYQSWGYRYIYPVTGELVGVGSDGEPVLTNAVALDKPRTRLLKKWTLKLESLSKCPAWLTYQWINECKPIYGFPSEGDKIIMEGIY